MKKYIKKKKSFFIAKEIKGENMGYDGMGGIMLNIGQFLAIFQ